MTNGSPVPDLVLTAAALVGAIEGAAAETERTGRLPASLLIRLHEAQLFRMLLPRSVAGLEVEPAVFVEVLETLAKGDASTAWMIAQGCGCSLSAAYLDPAVAREIFGGGDAVLAWGPSGTGAQAVSVDGGYRVTGQWHFASGNRHAQWLGGHCTVVAAGAAQSGAAQSGAAQSGAAQAGGEQVERTMLFPRSSARVEDRWQVMGLKGTGSDSYSVEDLFVPASHTYRREAAAERREAGALYRFTGMNIFAFGIAAMALGLARAMLDSFVAHARVKTVRTSGKPMRESGVIQAEVAQAEAKLLAARGFMLATARELYAAVASRALNAEERARMRLSTTWATAQARQVADFAYTAAGAAAIFEDQPFERRFRDLHTLTQQVQAHASNFELVGQSMLGVASASRLM